MAAGHGFEHCCGVARSRDARLLRRHPSRHIGVDARLDPLLGQVHRHVAPVEQSAVEQALELSAGAGSSDERAVGAGKARTAHHHLGQRKATGLRPTEDGAPVGAVAGGGAGHHDAQAVLVGDGLHEHAVEDDRPGRPGLEEGPHRGPVRVVDEGEVPEGLEARPAIHVDEGVGELGGKDAGGVPATVVDDEQELEAGAVQSAGHAGLQPQHTHAGHTGRRSQQVPAREPSGRESHGRSGVSRRGRRGRARERSRGLSRPLVCRRTARGGRPRGRARRRPRARRQRWWCRRCAGGAPGPAAP